MNIRYTWKEISRLVKEDLIEKGLMLRSDRGTGHYVALDFDKQRELNSYNPNRIVLDLDIPDKKEVIKEEKPFRAMRIE